MKPLKYRKFIPLLALCLGPVLHGQTLYWNPSPLSGDWANTVWSSTSGGTPTLNWTNGDNAVFDQTGTYTATINADQTATNIEIKAGALTFAGTNTAISNSLAIDSGASLTADSDRFLKVGTTSLTVNGTLTQTAAVTNSTRRVSLAGGNGSIVLSGGLRTGGNFNFAGDISGTGSIITDAGGTFTLSGNNTYAGDTLIRHGNTVRIGSSTAISSTSLLRVGGGGNIIFELTGADFSRTVGNSAGQVRFHASADGAGSSGFAAVNADRTVEINGTVSWGAGLFNPGVFHLGTAASTHKVTLTTGINLNGATRTINTTNGAAEVEGEISGVLSGTGASVLTKTGTGVLLLSNANTHVGGTVIAGSQGAINPLRISNGSALGSGGLTIGSGGNNDQSRLELTGGITVNNTIASLASRNNSAPSIVNVSGDNTISSNIGVGGGGSRNALQSDSGKLTLSGNATTRTLLLTGSGDGEIEGTTTIGATYGLEKAGNGTWTVNGGNLNNTIATVSAGKLLVNGTLANSSATVDGGTLGGTGSISGATTINSTGVLSPGASIGTFATGALTLNHNSTFLYELNTTATTGDVLNVNGDLTFDGTVTLSLADLGAGSILALGTKFTLISYFGSWDQDTFNGYADDSAFTLFGNEWRINYNDVSAGSVNGGAFTNAVTLTVIPEPGAYLLGGLGLLALLRRRR